MPCHVVATKGEGSKSAKIETFGGSKSEKITSGKSSETWSGSKSEKTSNSGKSSKSSASASSSASGDVRELATETHSTTEEADFNVDSPRIEDADEVDSPLHVEGICYEYVDEN